MTVKKDKEKIIDPVWSEGRIREFLYLMPPEGENADHHKLIKAYQSMRIEDFKMFVSFFVNEKSDLNAENSHGETVMDVISRHRYGKPYLDILNKYQK
tara:strand:+ start:257 stop:550 length:294 start_codon:yes stop_codon:yes gene_type:complete